MTVDHRDLGETLVEVVMTVVIIGITVTALISGLATTATAGNAHRESVTADAVLRNFAEAAKAASATCTAGANYDIGYTPPVGFIATMSPTGLRCPDPSTTALVHLTVTSPTGVRGLLDIRVRTP